MCLTKTTTRFLAKEKVKEVKETKSKLMNPLTYLQKGKMLLRSQTINLEQRDRAANAPRSRGDPVGGYPQTKSLFDSPKVHYWKSQGILRRESFYSQLDL